MDACSVAFLLHGLSSTSAVSQHYGTYSGQATLSLISLQQAVQHCMQQRLGFLRFAKEISVSLSVYI